MIKYFVSFCICIFSSISLIAQNDFLLSNYNNPLKDSIGIKENALVSFGFFDKKIVYNANVGAEFLYGKKDKFLFRISSLSGLNKWADYLQTISDSIKRSPGFDYTFKQFNHYLEFNLIYQPYNFLRISLNKNKFQIGEGYRSFLLSSQNSGLVHADIEVVFNRFKYYYFVGFNKNYDNLLNKQKPNFKFGHVFSLDICKWLNLKGYEVVCAARQDSLYASKCPDMHYFNPVIFFRPVEYSLGSPDNVLLGVELVGKYLKTHKVYAQLMLDEFNLKYLKEHNGWWACKYAYQMGVSGKFFDKISYLIEYNCARPYIYSHDRTITSYTSFNQSLAHPLGANLKEIVAKFSYKINSKFDLQLLASLTKFGADDNEISYGNNVNKSYLLRKGDYNNYILQGNLKNLYYADCQINYTLDKQKNRFLFCNIGARKLLDIQPYFMLGFKSGIFSFYDKF